MSYPDNNPKTAAGASKIPLHLVPPSATHYLALALADGAGKYGPYNWRDAAISVSVYKSAAQRHWDAYWDGEDNAADSGVHHLAHAMACCALLLDALTVGKLNDDRPTPGAAAKLQSQYVTRPERIETGGCAPPVYASPVKLYADKLAYDIACDSDWRVERGPARVANPLHKSATTETPQHPMAAESIREQDERLAWMEARL